ncbi:MAG: hypothetical protein KDE58_15425, partial [Caldilineaceae bacterium]|nr:hypothetical protein [Caldilineaceae bacterium]
IETYAILGGMPRNVTTVDANAPLLHNIANEILDPAGGLFNEVPLLLHEELKGEVDVYGRVLETISSGAHTRQQVATAMQTSLAAIQHYLNELQAIGALEHRLPLTRIQSERRQGTYHIVDPFLRFWHRWVAPSHRLLEINQRQRETLQEIRLNLAYIVAPIWESIARDHLLIASGQGTIPFDVQEIGSWWARSAQIDVVGVNRQTKQVLFGEARWRATNVTGKDLEVLVEKGRQWLHGDSSYWDVHYAFFARSIGEVTVNTLDAEQLHLFRPEDISDLTNK